MRSTNEASESARMRCAYEASDSFRARFASEGLQSLIGVLFPLLGGVEKGEALCSIPSALGSGAESVSDFFKAAGLFGIFGLPARFTGGGTLEVLAIGLMSGVGGPVGVPSDCAFGRSAFCTKDGVPDPGVGDAARLKVLPYALV